eukprot:CAMPEP_0118852042 /NCGR_PEP_ID=MMETSP1163-20130328/1231_1 /TAXON_ID=124430 /ORGANISM="Phaeomonas parva, Strain CCMP2877" /LENGTH=36 /DNA_ID= /DNA_START= /DNA_END= /DNA_ORIENTATION=
MPTDVRMAWSCCRYADCVTLIATAECVESRGAAGVG